MNEDAFRTYMNSKIQKIRPPSQKPKQSSPLHCFTWTERQKWARGAIILLLARRKRKELHADESKVPLDFKVLRCPAPGVGRTGETQWATQPAASGRMYILRYTALHHRSPLERLARAPGPAWPPKCVQAHRRHRWPRGSPRGAGAQLLDQPKAGRRGKKKTHGWAMTSAYLKTDRGHLETCPLNSAPKATTFCGTQTF